jgi:hypothetical protein
MWQENEQLEGGVILARRCPDCPAKKTKGPIVTPEERFERIEGTLERVSADIDKHNAGVRDLVRVSGIFLESQKLVIDGFKETDERIKMLIRTQEDAWKVIRDSDKKVDRVCEKLDRVADMLERFLKGLQKPNGSQ